MQLIVFVPAKPANLKNNVFIPAPIKPEIDVPESGRDIPVGDGSPVTMNIGDNVTAASNTTITIKCPVSGVPTPSVTWTKDGQNILESDDVFIRSDNSLVIKRAEIEDSAKFICSVHSQFGRKNISSKVTIVGKCYICKVRRKCFDEVLMLNISIN